MFEKLTRQRPYSTWALQFYCIVTTLYWLVFLFSVKHRSRVCQNLALPQHQQSSFAKYASSQSHDFPFKTWQISIGETAVEPRIQSAIHSWTEQNPRHRYEMITRGGSETYVAETFAHKPDLVRDFLAMQDAVMRADLLRHLLLYGDGGIYADQDTVCLQPFQNWIPIEFKDKVNLIIGIERDYLDSEMLPGDTENVGFGTGTIASKPGHFIIERFIERSLSRLRRLAEKRNTTIATLEASYEDIIDTTGPGLFSEFIWQELSRITGTTVTSSNLTGLTEPRLIEDVLILPVTGFSPGMPHSNAKGPEDEHAMVHHLHVGSWKADHPHEESVDNL